MSTIVLTIFIFIALIAGCGIGYLIFRYVITGRYKQMINDANKEANVINSEGDTIKGLGGGNCQVSSTLYNAVAQIPELEVIERHNHGAEVHYVPIGQDAAVAYGSMDFRFKNNLNFKIKLYASTDDKYITIRIAKVIE